MAQPGAYNPAFVMDSYNSECKDEKYQYIPPNSSDLHRVPPPLIHVPEQVVIIEKEKIRVRQTWDNSLEFLMSCIAMSIGLGNVWRFPFAVYENGGGAFLIPYLLVLLVIGKPFYYLEMIMGQFSSTSCIKVWRRVPALKGIGCAQVYSMFCLSTYYCAIMAITVIFFISSFATTLPWSECLSDWGANCFNSDNRVNTNYSLESFQNNTNMKSSAEFYFTNIVLKENLSIEDGIGLPDWKLTLSLGFAWCCIAGILARGVKSSGKAAYVLAIFPYIIMIALLIRAVTLKGAMDGILYFIKPDWKKLLEIKVWYAAVTQCFFSLSVCFGALIMYSSYNNFYHNIQRDVTVVTILDTFTSLLAGFTIFGILGNLASEMNIQDISQVVKSGAGLAFVSYPDAIAKFDFVPQLFSVLFFLMLYILGIGSGIGIVGGVITVINDQFPNWKHWHIVIGFSILGFLVGLIYCTPGGQHILQLVDHYAASFIVFFIAALEMGSIFWIYGLENFLDDVEFMLERRPSLYWRISWTIVTPCVIICIFIYTIVNLQPITYAGQLYPYNAYVVGNILLIVGVCQIPLWMLYTLYKNRKLGFRNMLSKSFKPQDNYGPCNSSIFKLWKEFKQGKKHKRKLRTSSKLKQFLCILFDREDKLE